MNIGSKLKYGSDLHLRVKEAIMTRVKATERNRASRITAWENAEKLYKMYTPTSEADAARDVSRKAGKPQFTTVVIPYSYATLLAVHTFWCSVFLNRSPILQYTGRHGESQQQTQAVDALVDYQVSVGGMKVPMYNWLMDAAKYGIGIIGNYWAHDTFTVAREIEAPKSFLGVSIPGTKEKVIQRQVLDGYVGNKIFNVRPQDFLPDTRVSLINLQKGEYCGRRVQILWNDIVKGKAAGDYFNLESVDRVRKSYWEAHSSGRDGYPITELPSSEDFIYAEDEETFKKRPAVVEAIEMTLEIIPKDFGLGAETYPEKWVFTVAFDELIIGAMPQGADHNMFPYFLQTYEFDAYGLASRGLLEILEPLNNVMDWLFNSHMYNVRQSLNNQLVADPSRVYIDHLKDKEAGKLILLRPEAYGTSTKDAVSQLQVYDITRGNMQDLQIVMELVQRVSGANDNAMGVQNPRGRKTATEVRSSGSLGVNRQKTIAEYNSALGWEPLGQVILQNSQQEYKTALKLRIVGDLMQAAPGFVNVTPQDIAGAYDMVPVDGTLPIDRFAQANLWKEILMGMAQMPQIAMAYDLGGIFSWMAQLAGLKNITQFKLKPQVLPDEEVARQAAAGNLEEVAGGSSAATDPGLRQAFLEAMNE